MGRWSEKNIDEIFGWNLQVLIFALPITKRDDLVAQLVEQYTFNVWALGSSPSRITKKVLAAMRGLFIWSSFQEIVFRR